MPFDPNQQVVVGAVEDLSAFLIKCPRWANDALNDIPTKKWVKAKALWRVGVVRSNVDAIRALLKTAGVGITERGQKALDAYDERVAQQGKRGSTSFPAWYPFKTTPRKHQTPGLEQGYGLKRYAIFMEMQTGKSKLSIDLACAHRMEGHIDAVLILVKRTLRDNWRVQLETHCPLPYDFFKPDTGKVKQFEAWLHTPHDFKWMAVGWESLSAGGMHELVERFVMTMGRVLIVGDETTYIAGHDSIRSKRAQGYSLQAEYAYALSGSPALEGPMQLFGQFQYLDPNIIGVDDYLAFRNRYAIMGGYMREVRPGMKVPTEIVGYQHLDELMKAIAPYTYQVLKREAYDLPDKRFETRTVALLPEQREVYDRIKREGVLQVGKNGPEHIIQNVLELSLRLHQVAGGYAVTPTEVKRLKKDGTPSVKMVYEPLELIHPTKNPKMLEVMAIIHDVGKKHQGIIWAVHHPEIDGLRSLLKFANIKFGELHGRVPDSERMPQVQAFQRGELQWMLANASTGGMGYTMMESQVNIFYNNTHKAIDRFQAEDRAYGDGQKGHPIWIDIMAEKTVDVVYKAALDAKQDLSEYVKHHLKEITRLLDGETL